MNLMTPTTAHRATIDDLMRFDGKAELIAGRIVPIMPTGLRPGLIGKRIVRSLDDYVSEVGRGVAIPDGVGLAVVGLASGRESFSPDGAYHEGPFPDDAMDFIPGAPTFAIEVRSKGDYGPAAEAALAAKRVDYFEAGTRVVWDVDPEAECVHKFVREMPDRPIAFRRGEIADAEPAVPGWRLSIDSIFA